MLLLQDFPLQWGYARIGPRRRRCARPGEAVDLLGHHPSIVQWMRAQRTGRGRRRHRRRHARQSRLRYIAGQQLPSWNKTVLDRWVKRAFERADPTRPSWPTAACCRTSRCSTAPTATSTSAGTTATSATSSGSPRRCRGVVRFVSASSAPSRCRTTADFIDPVDWPDLDWERLAEHHGLQKWAFDAARAARPTSPRSTSGGTPRRRYQAELIRHHIEVLRRLKYRPAGGFCVFAFNDPAPVVSWSVLDHARVPKPAYRRRCGVPAVP